MAKNYAISARGIHKSFGKLKVLDGIDLQVESGTVMALLGPNGAGKTTTVRILTTLLKADSGKITIQGIDVAKQPSEVRKVIGLTGQNVGVDEYLTGRENLRMMGRLYHLSKDETKSRTEELLEQFDLMDAANRQVKNYSGGMKRRLDLALSLIATPPVIFMDEPTTGLDPRSRLAMWATIKQLAAGGSTILLTTQQLEEADHLADKITVIDGGKVIAEGTADQLKKRVGSERIELVFADDANYKKARESLTDKSLQTDDKRRVLSVAIEGGVTKVKKILEQLDDAKIKVDSLSLHKPTLDDVFMELTGHQATMDEEKKDEGKK
jgi:ABC-2 type transport system ATP-binding protein